MVGSTFSAIRRRLHLVRYYSARRKRTPWARAVDVAMFLTLALAIPVNVLASMSFDENVATTMIAGNLYVNDDGRLAAYTSESPLAGDVRITARSTGSFALVSEENRHGWPIATYVDAPPPQVALDLYNESKQRTMAVLAEDDPIRVAIVEALERERFHDVLATWEGPEARRRHLFFGWLFGTGMWWVMMAAASAIAIHSFGHLFRIGSAKAKQRESMLAAEGRCTACGYDMRGLEFNERCPECGTLV